MSVNVIRPPEILRVQEPVLFLAGPIQGADDWQSEAIEIISSQLDAGTIASPRREYPEGTFFYEDQVDWEAHYLRRAGKFGAVMFWLATQAEAGEADERGFYRAFAQTSRFELAEMKLMHENEGVKLSIGIEPGFGNERYIRRRFSQDCPEISIYDNLEETCQEAIEQIDEYNPSFWRS